MTWTPPVELTGDIEWITISATDVANTEPCGLFLALKVHSGAKTKGWSRSWPTPSPPFPLGEILEHVAAVRSAPDAGTHEGLTAWLQQRFEQRQTHRCLRIYIQQAVENYLDVHEGIETELGKLKLLSTKPSFTHQKKSLNAWSPIYQTTSGIREIRRLRIGGAHQSPNPEDILWAATAAFVAVNSAPIMELDRIRVVEIGLLDGSVSTIFDGTPQEAKTLYRTEARDRATNLIQRSDMVACRSCGSCKAAGVCPKLPQVKGMLGQSKKGYGTRSVSPTDLELYSRCPAQWLISGSLNLPKDKNNTPEQARGQAAHEWLKHAHRSGIQCQSLDSSEVPASANTESLTIDDYENAQPYLQQHLNNCPLERGTVHVVSVEEDVYGYDASADVVTASRPDLMYREDDFLVIREFKTAKGLPSEGRDEVYNKYIQIAYLLSMLHSGLAAAHGAPKGKVEVEIMTSEASVVYSWTTSEKIDLAISKADTRRAVDDWHHDSEWKTKPGPQCSWCPVRKWCPDREVWQQSVPSSAVSQPPAMHASDPDDPPPF